MPTASSTPLGRSLTAALLPALLVLSAGSAAAQQDAAPSPFRIQGLVDLRYVRSSAETSFTDGGLGKTRYGVSGTSSRDLLTLATVQVLASAELSQDLSARVQLDLDLERDGTGRYGRVGLVEGFLSYHPEISPSLRLRVRAGAFFPPISLENSETFWTTPLTITPSAIDSWVGEELRTAGGEATLELHGEPGEVGLTGAAFWLNDPAGSLLAWRGFALHDRVTAFSDRIPLASIPAIQPGGPFPHQSAFDEPLKADVDGRAGSYAALTLRRPGLLELRGLLYDNRGVQTEFDGSQYAWLTRFASAGARLRLPGNVQLVGQYLGGRTRMGPADAVNDRFVSTYVLASVAFGRHRLSVRRDDFRVDDQDRLPTEDDNQESGSAWTFAYLLKTGDAHRLALELLKVRSDRRVRESLGLPRKALETQVQASFRYRF